MAEADISTEQDRFSCPVCQELLKEPVTTPCGHNFCKVCIDEFWDKEDQRSVYSCPQCKVTHNTRPELCRNNKLAKVVEELKENELQSASTHCYAGPGEVECDSCTGRKRKAVNSCLVCQASYCEDHLQPHYQSPAFKKHKLVEACAELQERICSEHDKLMEIYCRTDQSFICYLCAMDQHKGHDTVSTKTERTKKQNELKEEQIKSQQKIQEKQKKVQELKQTVDINKVHSQAAEEDERIFNELISSMQKKRSEVKELIRSQEEAEVSRAERLLNPLEQELADLNRRVTEMEQLSHTHDDIHFLQSFPSLCVSPGCDDSPSFTVNQHLSFDGTGKSLSDLKKQVEQNSEEEFNKIQPQAAAEQKILPSGPMIDERNLQYVKKRVKEVLLPKIRPQAAAEQKNLTSGPMLDEHNLQSTAVQSVLPSEPDRRADFLQYFCCLILDPNTAHPQLILSENNRVVTRSETRQEYSDHPERFDSWPQVLCKESVCRRCYWEVERSGDVLISMSYKKISRKGHGKESQFGFSSQSWSLRCSSSSVYFWHNNHKTVLQGPSSSRIGVYVDHSAGTLSFYSVSDTMRLLHRVHTTFTQPLYAGFCIWSYDLPVSLCDPK